MLRLSNRDVPAGDRLSYLHDFVARSVAGLHFTPRDRAGFAFELASLDLGGGTVVGSARYSAVTGARTRELTADGRQNYMLTIHEAGYEIDLNRGRGNISVATGDVVIVRESLEQTFTMPETSLLAIVLDERRMNALAPAIATQPLHHLPAATPGAALLAGYGRMLLEHSPLQGSAAQLAAEHLYQLAGLALERGKGAPASEQAGIGEARLALVKEDIARNLSDAGLDIAAVARRQGITPRYVQRLFEREGTSFSQFLRDSRLDLAREAIESSGARTIAAIAFDCGFGDLSHFNKVFRQRFSATPREIKATTLLNKH
ncbi:MAG: AraC family transcriptional regulator [Mesorhizobium sp.]|nr:AraC family transcriptional regulator [Mesorhizobium sp.]MBL8576675.1 AraC family transcriptional regulator [Mesorhizobium sp.]